MDFKDLYDDWLDRNGGLSSSIEESWRDWSAKKKTGSITTQSVTDPFMKTGSLYLFDYVDRKMIERVVKEDAPFFDGHPFVLALEHDKQYQYALNLNLLPIQARFLLFSVIYKIYWGDIQFNIGKRHQLWREFKRIDSVSVQRMAKLKSKMAINKYDITIIKGLNAVEWESAVPASTLYMKHNMIFNKKKNIDMKVIWSLMF